MRGIPVTWILLKGRKLQHVIHESIKVAAYAMMVFSFRIVIKSALRVADNSDDLSG